ncbi:MAG: glycosyltransferase [candidate division NC10 bacterium]|nr:glycosyltransferase [candidate division NC10 bacterium]
MLSVSVVVPVRNATRTLPHCLAALERLEPAPAEILLVDNGSTDGSLQLLRAFARDRAAERAQVLEEPRRGAAAARNAGIRVAKGEVLAFTDADCAPDPCWLRHVTGPFVDPTVGAVAGRVVAAPAASTLELFSALYTLQLPARPARRRHWTPWEGGYPTANFAIRRALAQELEGFDENVGIYGEDYDLCARLYALGAEIVYVTEARVAHHHRTTLAGLLRQAFGFGRSHPYLLRRHTARGLWMDLPWHSLAWSDCPIRAWLDLASADKKVLAIVLLGALYGPVLLLLPLYAVWLAVAAGRRARRVGVPASPAAAVGLAGLLVLKSAAMTAGRWWGSVKYGTVCF